MLSLHLYTTTTATLPRNLCYKRLLPLRRQTVTYTFWIALTYHPELSQIATSYMSSCYSLTYSTSFLFDLTFAAL